MPIPVIRCALRFRAEYACQGVRREAPPGIKAGGAMALVAGEIDQAVAVDTQRVQARFAA
jgi:hypothetical protein